MTFLKDLRHFLSEWEIFTFINTCFTFKKYQLIHKLRAIFLKYSLVFVQYTHLSVRGKMTSGEELEMFCGHNMRKLYYKSHFHKVFSAKARHAIQSKWGDIYK